MEYLETTLLLYGGAVAILLIPIPILIVIAMIRKLWN